MQGITPGGFAGCVSSGRAALIVPQNAVFAGCRIAFRGHLANRPQLIEQLGAAREDADATLVALAHRRYGERAALHLQGEFAAAIVTEANGETLLLHDAVGLSPLFYATRVGQLVFATHLCDLANLFTGEPLDEEYLADFLAYGQPTGERTPFRSIRRLLPGEVLHWSPSGARRVTLWSVAALQTPIPEHAEEQTQQFLQLLQQAVSGAASSAGRVWTELSGGLDSSTVACIAARLKPAELAAVSVVYPRWATANERECMQCVSAHLQLPWHELDGCLHLPFLNPPGDFIGEPSPLAYTVSLSSARDRLLEQWGVSVLLTGLGGDEVMGGNSGMPYHLSDPLFAGHPAVALRAVRQWNRSSVRSFVHTCWKLLLQPALRHLRGLQVWEVPSHRLPDWIDVRYRDSNHLADRCSQRLAPKCRTPSRQFVADLYWLMAMTVANRAQRGARYDIRHPLMARPLLEFMTCLPWEQKLTSSGDRVLQRQALRGILPERIRQRTTKGGGTWALVEGLRQSQSWCELLTHDPQIVARGMATREGWSLAVRRARLGHTQSDRYLMAGISLETWLGQLPQARDAARRLRRSVAHEDEVLRTMQAALEA